VSELLDHVQQQLNALHAQRLVKRWVLAFSGGMDSSVLLHAIKHLPPSSQPKEIVALHINHQLSACAADWQQHSQTFAKNLGVKFYCEVVNVQECGRGLEDAARQARYDVFEKFLQPGDVLLMGHHSDDQVETMLLRLMRGAGPNGLAGIRPQRAVGAGFLFRPLLDLSRQQLHQYATRNNLNWVEDDSNADTRFDRNYLRAQVLPKLAERWPGYQSRWQQSARYCAQQAQNQDDVLAALLPSLDVRPERLGVSISLLALQALAPEQQLSLLRYWLGQRGVQAELAPLQQAQQQLILGREDAVAEVRIGSVACVPQSLRRFDGRVYLLPVLPELPATKGPQTLLLSECARPLPLGELLFTTGSQSAASVLAKHSVEWRFRQGSERCRPAGRGHSQTLKKLLLEYRLEPWLRPYVPLIYIDGELAAVAGLWVCQDFVDILAPMQLQWCLQPR
jgi:tRNA(Ile)-lysidine synthase